AQCRNYRSGGDRLDECDIRRDPLWEHRWMEPQDDPEARIRDLERPLADTARASEMGATQTPAGYPYPPGSPVPPPPFNYGRPFPGASQRPPSGNRALWIL